jgi:signal transduction histidine kinase
MNDLVDQLLNFSRIQNKQLELKYSPDLNLNQLIQRVIEQHRQNPQSHNFAVQLPDQSLFGSFDAGRIEQVLDNLINNALKYSPAETTVTVGLEASRPTDTDLSIKALIWVRDEGFGISKEAQEHIFDRFYRVRTRQTAGVEGLGLGLYVSNEIVRQHGGHMWLESQPGEGSTFYLSLPLTPPLETSKSGNAK